jgi:hypothetical protein
MKAIQIILKYIFLCSVLFTTADAQFIRLSQMERAPDSLYMIFTDAAGKQYYAPWDTLNTLLTIGASKWTDVGSGNIYRNSMVSIATTADPTGSLTIKKTAGNNILRLINASDTSAFAVSVSADPPNRRGFRSDGPTGIYQLNFPTDYTSKIGLNINPGGGSAEGWATGTSSGDNRFVNISAIGNPVGGSGNYSWLTVAPIVNGSTSGIYNGIFVTKSGSGSTPSYNAIYSDDGNWIQGGDGHLRVSNITTTERGSLTQIGAGSIIWNTDSTSAQIYTGSAWINFPGAGGGTLTSVAVSSTDLSVSGSPITTSGTFTLNINNSAVTYAKIQNVTGERLLGRYSASTGVVQEISLGTGLAWNGTTIESTSSGGTVTSVAVSSTDLSVSGSPITSSGTFTLNINSNAVTTVKVLDANITYAKIQNVTAQRLVGRHAGTNGVMQEITLGSGLQWNGSSIESISGGSGTVTSVAITSSDLLVSGSPITTAGTFTLNLANSAVDYANIQNVTQARILGRYTASTGVVQEISIGSGLALNSTSGVLSTTGGSGTVTSVGLTAPAQFTVTGTPVTSTGTLALAWANASANTIFSGPISGSAAVPAFRSLVADDIPLITGTLKVQMNTARILGRTTAGFGLAQEITIGTGLSFSAGTLTATTLGSVTSVAISSTDLSVSGSPITTSGTFTLNINNLAVTTAKINNSAVTFAKMQNISSGAILGRYTGGSGVVQEISIGSGLSLSGGGVLSSSGSSNWTLSGSLLYPNSTSTYLALGANSTPSSSYRLYVNGITYNSSEMYVGGVMTLSVGTRGYVNARMKEGGNTYGGYIQHSASGNTHGVTTILSNQIWQSNKSSTDGTEFTSISSNESSTPLLIDGIQNNTTSRFSAAVTIRGSVRSGTTRAAGNSGDEMFAVYNNTTRIFTAYGNRTEFNLPLQLPSWTTAGRPASPNPGMIGFNSTTNKIEARIAAAWVDLH